jgi:hypothetical protein
MRQAPAVAPPTAGQQSSGGLPAGWQQHLQQMSPEERERFLQNNEKFRSLPQSEKDQIRQRFKEWDQLSPKQKAKMNQNAEALGKLTPQQRDTLRTNVLPQWRQMSPERRKELSQRLGALNGLSDAERNQKLNDPNFYQGLSPQEHDVLKQLGEYKLTPGAGAY